MSDELNEADELDESELELELELDPDEPPVSTPSVVSVVSVARVNPPVDPLELEPPPVVLPGDGPLVGPVVAPGVVVLVADVDSLATSNNGLGFEQLANVSTPRSEIRMADFRTFSVRNQGWRTTFTGGWPRRMRQTL